MKNFINKIIATALLFTLVIATSCNKGFEDVPFTTTASGPTLSEKLNTDPTFSFYRDALVKYGLINQLSVVGNGVTAFGLDNATLTAVYASFGLTPAQFIALPSTTGTPLTATQAATINGQFGAVFQYSIVATNLPSARFPSSYSAASSLFPAQVPNVQMPTAIVLPGGNPLVRMNIFPAKNGAIFYANTVPIVTPDAITASNGTLHRVPTPVTPPSQVLAQMIYTDPNHTYLTAAIARADSGQVGLNRLDSVLKFGVANITVFAPTNLAFQTLLTGAIAQALIAQGVAPATALAQATFLASTPAVFSNPALFGALSAQTVRGIVVYHLLGNRTFSNNLPLSTASIRTLLNSAIAAHPGVVVDRSTASPRLLGLGNGGNFSNFTALDRHAVNGVWHVIDRVLLPQ